MRLLFWGASLFIAYTYLGYVGWLWIRARVRPWPVLHAKHEPHVSILMVVRNEEGVIAQKLENLLALDYPAKKSQIIVVSDGSTDRSNEILREYAANPRIQIVLKQISEGKACGLNDAMSIAGGEIVVFMDARQEIEREAVRALIANFADLDVGCVSGELMLGDRHAGETARSMSLYWRIEKEVRELESASGSVVGATGALYAARRALIPVLPPGTLLDDVFVPMEIVRQGKRVVFEPRARAWDAADLGAEREFGRKVRTLTGNYQLVQLAPWLLSSRNPIRFEFVCHKLLRLIVPFALAVVLLASAVLPGPVYRAALILQILFYGLSLMAKFRLVPAPIARIPDAALTFVILNTAALMAFINFITGRGVVWNATTGKSLMRPGRIS